MDNFIYNLFYAHVIKLIIRNNIDYVSLKIGQAGDKKDADCRTSFALFFHGGNFCIYDFYTSFHVLINLLFKLQVTLRFDRNLCQFLMRISPTLVFFRLTCESRHFNLYVNCVEVLVSCQVNYI